MTLALIVIFEIAYNRYFMGNERIHRDLISFVLLPDIAAASRGNGKYWMESNRLPFDQEAASLTAEPPDPRKEALD